MSLKKWNGKVADLPTKHRKIMEALIRFWLENTETGRQLLLTYSKADAIKHLCELKDAGLVKFVTDGRRPVGRGGSFGVRAVLPPEMRQ